MIITVEAVHETGEIAVRLGEEEAERFASYTKAILQIHYLVVARKNEVDAVTFDASAARYLFCEMATRIEPALKDVY